MSGYNQISLSQLMRLIGTPSAPVIIDVRDADDYPADPRIIPTSRHIFHTDIAAAIPDLDPARHIIVTCQRGKKLSEGTAALLRSHGLSAESLEGGHLAWIAADLPVTTLAALPPRPSLWVTRNRPKIDRIACPWLIRRFVDADARFLFVAPAEVAAVAEKFNATAFDIPDAPYTHQGDKCSFDAMIDAFGLSHPALDMLAKVVRAADTDTHAQHPVAAGLLAISVGLSRQYKDDLAQLDAGLILYDALYRWARDGQNETHDWAASAS